MLFTILAFLITLGSGMIVVLSNHSELVNGARPVRNPIPLPFPIAIVLVMVGAFGPALAALVVSALRTGRTGVRKLLLQFRRWRVGPIWYAAAFFGPALLGVLALVATALSGGTTPARWFSLPRPLLLAGWTVGPWGEELGWRGYAQTELQQRMGAFGASALVGTTWSI